MKTEYLIKIVYKNGHTHEFWCFEFSYKNQKGVIEVSWEKVSNKNYPLLIGTSDISSIWVVDTKETTP